MAELRERFINMGPLAADALEQILAGGLTEVVDDNGKAYPVYSVEPKDRLKAIEIVMDRLLAKKIEMQDKPDEHRDLDEEIEVTLKALQREESA